MFGISNNVRSRVVRVCTPELFHQVVHSPLVGRICAEIADALEAMRRGEMAPEDFDTLKSERKKPVSYTHLRVNARSSFPSLPLMPRFLADVA